MGTWLQHKKLEKKRDEAKSYKVGNTRKIMDRKLTLLTMSLLSISGCIDCVVIYEEQKEQNEIIKNAEEITIIFFYTPGCGSCTEVETWLEELKLEYGSKISVRSLDVLTKEGWDEFKDYGFTVTPAVVISEKVKLQHKDLTKEYLTELIEKALGKKPFGVK